MLTPIKCVLQIIEDLFVIFLVPFNNTGRFPQSIQSGLPCGSYRYMWLSKVFGEELGIAVDKVFGCRSPRLLRDRVQLLQKHRVQIVLLMNHCIYTVKY